MASFRNGGVDIAYLDEGEGEPVVLVHGFASTKEVNWVHPGWVSTLTRAGRRAIALVPGEGRPLRETPLGGPVLFALGAERAGLPEDVVAACDEVAHVPVDRDAAESLNVAMIATLCLYEYRARHV